jgi:predicted RNase H-like HicB family nuclease
MDRGEDEHFVAECPSLPGGLGQGRTRQEAFRNIRETTEDYFAALREDGLPVASAEV